MPAAFRRQPQLSMDETVIDDPHIAAALEARQDKKDELNALRKEYDEVNDKALAAVERLELPEGRVVRVGRFRIARQSVAAGHVEFDKKASSRLQITLLGQD